MEAPIESLPGDLSGLLLSFLTGFDLLPLAHASPMLYRCRLSSNGEEWRSRQAVEPLDVRRFRWAWTHGGDKHSKRFGRSILPREEPKPWFKSLVKNVVTALRPSGKTKLIRNSYAHQYFTHESLLFYGQPRSANGSFQYGGIISVPVKPLLAWKRESFAIDLWFAPLSVPGVLLSMEFRHSAEDYLPHYQSIIHVDEQGRLYCSMIDNATVVCAKVKPHQWYHLALSYQQDPTGENGVQCVYLNGELVVSQEGVSLLHHIDACQQRLRSLGHDTTFELTACQIGAQGDNNPFPAASNFDGIIDDVRFWRDELTQEDVHLLFRGNDRQVTEQVEYEWSLKQSVSVWFEGQVTCVLCSRPQEGRCVEIQPRLVVIRDNFASKLKRYRRRRPSRSNS